MEHIFAAKHNLGGLVRALGSREGVVNAVSRGVASLGRIQTNAHGVFTVTVKINGKDVGVTGKIIRDTIHISNFWIR